MVKARYIYTSCSCFSKKEMHLVQLFPENFLLSEGKQKTKIRKYGFNPAAETDQILCFFSVIPIAVFAVYP